MYSSSSEDSLYACSNRAVGAKINNSGQMYVQQRHKKKNDNNTNKNKKEGTSFSFIGKIRQSIGLVEDGVRVYGLTDPAHH